MGHKAKDNDSFFKVTPLTWAIEGHIGGLNLQKKKKNSQFLKKGVGGRGLKRLGWFPTFYQFLIVKASPSKAISTGFKRCPIIEQNEKSHY